MSDIEKKLRACQETPDGDIEKEVARIYDLLRELPLPVRHGLQCFIYDCPLTKPIKREKYLLPNDDRI